MWEDYTILKLILQPIVENAILYGIICKKGKSGIITITCCKENGGITIKMEEDGIGIPADKLENLISGLIESRKGSGFGVRNTNERIQLYYGMDYGLFFSSIYGKGTSVEIRIPAEKNHTLQKP
ncbi:MAG TPA: ATP-binding protein [Ruminiclostridium sp.]|nr:ATP-binding protein [Ruminiclostridium sp.]